MPRTTPLDTDAGGSAAVDRAAGWSTERPLRVQVVLFGGAEEQDFIGPYEVFSLAGRLSSGAVRVGYVTGAPPRTVTAAFGTEVVVATGWSTEGVLEYEARGTVWTG